MSPVALLVSVCIYLAIAGITLTDGWLFKPTVKNQVCYGTLGCFSGDAPFTNTQGLLPRSPVAIGTKFILFSRNSTGRALKGDELVLNDHVRRCSWKSFCQNKTIRLIIHGYMDSADKLWVKHMTRALLKYEDCNVIVVDWRVGAREINYYQSASNTRVVGAQVAQLLTVIQNVFDIGLEHVHIIGHSLGSHAAGYVGEYLEGIGRITGLDPAGPAFENTDERVRLDPSDANFVDVIHTDAEHLFSLGSFPDASTCQTVTILLTHTLLGICHHIITAY